MEKGKASELNGFATHPLSPTSFKKRLTDQSALSRLGDIIKIDHEAGKPEGDGWKEFKKGI
jgi:hypothetical protein